jgi:hypothetical protein
MKKRSTGWQGIVVAGIMACTVPPYAYGQVAESGAAGGKSGTPADSPSAESSSSQPDQTKARSMPTDVSDLRGATTPNRGTTPKATEGEGRRAAPQQIMPPQSHPSTMTPPLPQTPE